VKAPVPSAPVEASVETRPEAGAPVPAEEQDATPAGAGALPNLIVIGAQKCGTSGLHYYLGFHPEISMSRPKEVNFFIKERNWKLGVDWYMRHFDPEARVRGESSPNYSAYPHHTGVPKRMNKVVPDARLIYIVRDPLERIESHWVHNFAKRREKGDLAETLMHPNTTYVVRSQYFMQLQQFLNHYRPEQILVIDQEDLLSRRMETLREVFTFVGVDPTFEHPRFVRERHRSEKKQRATRLGARLERLSKSRLGGWIPKGFWLSLDSRIPLSRPIERPDVKDSLDPEVLRVLTEDANKLREFTGRGFENWSV
jgi:hypothetical protein